MTALVESPAASHTWEQAVAWLCSQPDQQALVRACYYDDPLLDAAERFAASEEWAAVAQLLPVRPGKALDLGAGRGISSFALARSGWDVVAVEPDASERVGAGAIRALADAQSLRIRTVASGAEELPIPDGTFDLVYGRQVLHHARNLPRLCREAARVLRPAGRFVATREHVISRPEDLAKFHESHPLHRLYGGEHAYLLAEYTDAIVAAGLRLTTVLGHYDSVINYFPMTTAEVHERCRSQLARSVGRRLAIRLADSRHVFGRRLLARLARTLSRKARWPGRLYSFIATKPM